jgi:hypothetical protein
MALEFISSRPDPNLLDLPWRLPLEEWPEDILAALPRGISRHVVRFVRLGRASSRMPWCWVARTPTVSPWTPA